MYVDGVDRRVAALYAVAAVVAAAAVAILGDPRLFGPWSPWWPAAAGLACAAGSVVTPLRRQATAAAMVRAVCWLACGGWVGWGYAYGIYATSYWQALGFGGLGLGVLASVFATPTGYGEPMRPPPVPLPARSEWAEKIEQATRGAVRGARNIVVAGWDTAAGYRVTGDCPDGVTWQVLQRFEAELAGLLNLPRGCGVSVGPGERRGGFTVDVSTVDAMAGAREYPA